MNILITATDFKPNLGGIAEYTHQLAAGLARRGHKIIIWAPARPGAGDFDCHAPYCVKRYDPAKIFKLPKLKRYLVEYRRLKSIVRSKQIDLILANHIAANPYIAWLAAKFLHVPFAVIAYGLEVKKNLGFGENFKRRCVLKNAKLVMAISQLAKHCVKKIGVAENKITVINPGVVWKDFTSSQSKENSPVTDKFSLRNKKVILTLGRLVPRKGQDTVIRAMPEIVKRVPEAIYLIAGDGPDKARLQRIVKAQGLEDGVIFAGAPDSHLKPRDFYNAADVFAMINRETKDGDIEGFGIVFLEANAAGIPVVAGRSGGAMEAVVSDRTGRLVDPESPQDTAKALTSLLRDHRQAEKLGRAGKERVRKKCSWARAAAKTEQAFKKLIV